MTTGPPAALDVTPSLRSADGAGVVRLEARLAGENGEVWAALTEPGRLARWYGTVEGELGPGGEFRSLVHASGAEGVGRVDACEPARRFRVVFEELDAARPDSTEVTLTADGDGTAIVVEQHGLPLDLVWAYGAGLQIHLEDLAAYLAGRDRVDAGQRFEELKLLYTEMSKALE
jgi:uncharacterized protein YndB with AHSA1/START domain